MDIDMTNRYKAVEGTGMHRTILVVEILSDRPVGDMCITDIAREITQGDFSGRYETLDTREVSKPTMAGLLREQDSEPDFLLGENGWKYGLHNGDEITINTGDNELPPSIIINEIEYLPGDTVRVLDKEGQRHECFIKDIS